MSRNKSRRKICVVVNSRANYGRIKSVMRAVQDHPDLELQTIVGASALLYRFGHAVDNIRADGFEPSATVYSIVEGENPTTMAKSTGMAIMDLSTQFENLRPDVVLTVADRFETIATAMGIGRKVGKISVLVGNCFGFVGNRMLHGYTGEGTFLLESGALPQQVDAAIYDFGLAMGPFAMGDVAGLDVGWLVRKAKAADRPTNEEYGGTIPDRICELGRYGQKTAGGYYDYAEGDRTPIPNPEVQAIIEQVSKEKNITRKDYDAEEVVKRALYPLINIGAQILDEGMAMRPSDIDIIYINGYGFPAYKGGPMHWADAIGLDKVLADMKRFHAEFGERWRPAPLLEKLVAEGKSFADYQAA